MSQDILTAISDAVGTEVFGIWFLIGAALVFFMQAGFQWSRLDLQEQKMQVTLS